MRTTFRHVVCLVMWAIALCALPLTAQVQDQLDTKTRKTMDDAAKKGHPLTVVGAVSNKVSVEAVLLPYDVARHVFGREVADSYASVEITVSNHSTDASLIVHTVFIDYSQWALSGYIYLKQAKEDQQERARKAAEQGKDGAAGTQDEAPLQTQTTVYESETKPNQIASVEYRAVRGQALDAQPWTKRNITIRALRLAGSIASAYSFVTRDQDIIHGITAFAGQGVPAAETFWPDGTVEQMNRISDLGFKVNKVIPKNASDVIVAFFPLDRFLTPGLKVMFKKSPALFFAPYAMAFDHEARKQLRPLFVDFIGKDEADKFMKALPLVYMCNYLDIVESTEQKKKVPVDKTVCEKNIKALGTQQNLTEAEQGVVPTVMKFLSHASLNTVRVVVGGDFTVNVNDVPATINALEMDGGNAVWSSAGKKTGTLRGSFLNGGKPQIAEAEKLGISELDSTDNTNDTALKFTMTLKSPLKPGTVLTFKVTKTNAETKKSVESMPFPFTVPALAGGTTMDVSDAITRDKDDILTIKGRNFADTAEQPLKVLLFSGATKPADPAKANFTLTKANFQQQNPDEIDIDLCTIKDFQLDDSTWTVMVQQGDSTSTVFPTFKAFASAKDKCPKTENGSAAAKPQTTTKGQGSSTVPGPGKNPPTTSGGGKKQKKGTP
jgi:hypothetical protein